MVEQAAPKSLSSREILKNKQKLQNQFVRHPDNSQGFLENKLMLNQEKGNFNMLLTLKEISVKILAEPMLKEQRFLWPYMTKIITFAKRVRKVSEQKDDCSLQQSKRENFEEGGESDF